MASKQVLTTTQATSDLWKPDNVQQFVTVSAHSGGEWVVQVRTPDGEWVDLDVLFDDNGQKTFYTLRGWNYRLHGGTEGAKAWVTDSA